MKIHSLAAILLAPVFSPCWALGLEDLSPLEDKNVSVVATSSGGENGAGGEVIMVSDSLLL